MKLEFQQISDESSKGYVKSPKFFVEPEFAVCGIKSINPPQLCMQGTETCLKEHHFNNQLEDLQQGRTKRKL